MQPLQPFSRQFPLFLQPNPEDLLNPFVPATLESISPQFLLPLDLPLSVRVGDLGLTAIGKEAAPVLNPSASPLSPRASVQASHSAESPKNLDLAEESKEPSTSSVKKGKRKRIWANEGDTAYLKRRNEQKRVSSHNSRQKRIALLATLQDTVKNLKETNFKLKAQVSSLTEENQQLKALLRDRQIYFSPKV